MKQYDKLIFVSNSDTALGPMAEAIFQDKFLFDVLDVTSKGAIVLFPEPINPKAEAVLADNGLTMQNHMSAPLLPEDFNERTLILATDENVCQKLRSQFGELADMVPTVNEYVGEKREVTNPYGGALADYGQSYMELDSLLTKLAAQLNMDQL